MTLIEKLGSFYLGREHDLAAKKTSDVPVNYDARDLTTHAVCVGMTGSGKTGLCIGLLEEAALDGVPAIIIDPKGDLTNLLLTFPQLLPADFLPWINADDARRKNLTPEAFAEKTAKDWRDGLASWEQGPERIQALKDAAEFTIYTPGSDAGIPVSVLSSFAAPKLDWDTETEALRDRVQGMVSALLGLAGIDADPVQSREHILLSTIVETAWRQGEDLDMAKLIHAVQKPPFRQVGVFDVDTFYPEKERFSLAMALNSIIASPSFSAWLSGDALDVQSLLYTPQGKPRHSIFYIAHLSDAERMFFVTILLEQVIAWMRAQTGTTSLRALLYMDEVFGFFPPIANPPSKRPMLTLLKQARAFGLGVMLTTQNPADLDYKGLTNTGTWFIGKLQAERDKMRLMEGLESAIPGGPDSRTLEKLIASLESRVFLLHNVNQSVPMTFYTRWAMSYLRGPLTRQQIKELMAGRKAGRQASASRPAAGAVVSQGRVEHVAGAAPGGLSEQPPVLPPGIPQVYLPVALSERDASAVLAEKYGARVAQHEARLVYEPALFGLGAVHYTDRKTGVDSASDHALLLRLESGRRDVAWRDAEAVDVSMNDLAARTEPDAFFVSALPEGIANAKALAALKTDLVDYLYRTASYGLMHNLTLKLFAKPGEDERDFRARCQQAAREARDADVDTLRTKYSAKLNALEVKITREQAELGRDQAEYKGRIAEEAVEGLSGLAGMFGLLGRRKNAGTAISQVAANRRITAKAKSSIDESQATIQRLIAEGEALKAELQAAANELTAKWSAAIDDIAQVNVTPKKSDISVRTVAIAWAPVWEITFQDSRDRAQTETVPAYPVPAK